MSEQINYRMSENVDGLFKALSAAQKVMTGALKDAANPFFKSKYADLSSVWDACRAPLADNGLSIMQPVSADGDKVTVSTILAHESGQWIASDLTMTSVKSDPQGLGSCITYARRYALSAMVGVAPEDDDGNAASSGSKEKQQAVVERKLSKKEPEGEAPEGRKAPTAIAEPKPVPNPEILKNFAEMNSELGEVLYLRILDKHGFKSAAEIADVNKARQIYKELGAVRVLVVAATHGEILPGVDEAFFNALPVTSRAAVFAEMKEKLCKALGSRVSGLEEFELTRRECAGRSQWAFYSALAKSHEAFSKQGVA